MPLARIEDVAMKYPDGQAVKLGDRVKVGDDDHGVVVISFDTAEYSAEYTETQWGGYLKTGVMINFPLYGLIHYKDPEPDLELVERASSGGEKG
jgi:hypothetical protein